MTRLKDYKINEERTGTRRTRLADYGNPNYWRDAIRTMQESNAIGNPELIGGSGLNISLEEIMARGRETAGSVNIFDAMKNLVSSPDIYPEGEWTPPPGMFTGTFDPMAGTTVRSDLNAINQVTDVVTYPLQLVLMGVNSAYEGLRPQRREPIDRGNLLDRIGGAFGGSEWEGLHPDIQAVLWEPIKDTLLSPMGGETDASTMITSILLLSGQPDMALRFNANQASVQDVLSSEPYTGQYNEMIPPVERGVRQFATETLFDPLMWIPGAGGFIPKGKGATGVSEVARQSEAMVNLLEGAMVDPRTGRILPSWKTTTLAGGVRPPTLGEYIGWGVNKFHSEYRRITDPFGGIRRIALRRARYFGANAVQDMAQMPEWENYIQMVAKDSGLPVEEVRAGATQILEEVLAADKFSLRGNRGKVRGENVVAPESLRVTSMSPEDVAILEAQRSIGKTPSPTIVEKPWVFGSGDKMPILSPEEWEKTIIVNGKKVKRTVTKSQQFIMELIEYDGDIDALRSWLGSDWDLQAMPDGTVIGSRRTKIAQGKVSLFPDELIPEAGLEQRRMFGEPPERMRGVEEPRPADVIGMGDTGEYRTGYLRPRGGTQKDYIPGVTEPPIDPGGEYYNARRYTPGQGTRENTIAFREQFIRELKNKGWIERREDLQHFTDDDWSDLLSHYEEEYIPPSEEEIELAREYGEPLAREPRVDFDPKEGPPLSPSERAVKIKNEVMRLMAEEMGVDYWDIRRTVEFLENPHIDAPVRIGTVRGPQQQMRLVGTSEEAKPLIDSIVNIQTERFNRGWIPRAPDRAIYESMPMSQLERTLEVINNAFIGENAQRLAGIRVFQKAVKSLTGVRPAVVEATESIIRELPAFREASPEAIKNMASLLYETAWDSLNVGPRAPLARERAAGLLGLELDSHLGYIKHVAADEIVQSFEEAAKRAGWGIGDAAFIKEKIKKFMRQPAGSMNRNRVINEVGKAIRHESTRARGFRGSITEGNKIASEGRMGWTWENVPGAMPEWKILEKGEPLPRNWVPIKKAFQTDLATLVAERRISASRAVEGVNYLDEVMTKHGTYSPNRRPPNATSIFDLAGMSDPKTGNPTRMWDDVFGQLTPEIQERLKNTYFPNVWREGDGARAVLKWNSIAQGTAWIKDMEGIERLFWATHKPISKYWKSKTLFGFTSYHLRNNYDDMVRLSTWFDHWNPDVVMDSFNTMYHGQVPEYAKEFIGKVKGVPAAEITAEDVLYYARGEGAFEAGMYWDEVQKSLIYDMGKPDRMTGVTALERLKTHGYIGADKGEKLVHHPANPFSTNFIWDQTLKEFGMDAENVRRLSGFYAGMKEPGMTLEKLGEKVRMVMIDYLDQSPFWQVAREFSPFIMFQRHAIPLNVRALFEKPGKVSLRMRAYAQMDRMATEIYQRDDKPPSWNEGRAYRVGKDYWFLPQNFDSMFDIEDLLGTFTRFVGGDRAAGGKLAGEYLAPWITEPGEQLFNYDLYRGTSIYDRWEGEKVPQFLRDMGLSERGMTHLWHAISSTWRAAKDAEGLWKMATGQKELQPDYVARRIGGLPVYQADPAENTYWLLKKNTVQLEQLDIDRTYGNWSFYDIQPDRYVRAAELFGERIATQLLVNEYLTEVPFTDDGTQRPFEEDLEVEGQRNIKSQKTMLGEIKSDLRGMWALQDKFELDLKEGRTRESQRPFTEAELQFISNFYNTIIMTEIGLAKMGAEKGEITPEQMESRVRSRYNQLVPQENK